VICVAFSHEKHAETMHAIRFQSFWGTAYRGGSNSRRWI